MRASRILWVATVMVVLLMTTNNKAQDESSSPEEEVTVEVEQETPDTSEEQTEVKKSSPEDSDDEQSAQEQAEKSDEPAQVTEEKVTESEETPAQPAQEKTETPAEPALVPEPEPEVAVSPDEIVGIDTVDLEDPQGNWLYKRVWWERAEAKYEKIRAAVSKVLEQRAIIFEKRSALDRDVFDPFYLNVGFKRGQLQEALTNLISTFESHTSSNSSLLEKAQQDKEALEALQVDVDKVVAQDQEVEKATLQLVEQINRLRNYEQQAWRDFKDIARVLDDRKARELFYNVDNVWRNVQEIQNYVEQNFAPSFDKIIEEAKQQTNRVQSMIEDLKGKGISLKQELDGEETDEEASATASTFFGRFVKSPLQYAWNTLKKLFNMIVSLVRWPIDALMGTAPSVQDRSEDNTAQQAVETAPIESPEEKSIGAEAVPAATPEEASNTPQESVEIKQKGVEESEPAVDRLAPMDEAPEGSE